MAELTVYELAGLPSVSLTGMTKGTDYLQIISRASLRVRLHHASDIAAVRPYYLFKGAWWPLMGDGDDTVSSTPCTVDATKLNGRADRLFRAGGISGPVILVCEDGEVPGLTAYLDIADAEG